MELDPKVAYWTAALLNMLAAVALAAFGVRRVRGGDVTRHQRLMKTAGLLVVLFLLSYVAKVTLLGREQLELWEPRFVHVLRFHELCVAVMVLAGGTALYLATRGRFAESAARPHVKIHRAAGWTAVVSSALGVVTAAYVLYGMYARLS